MKVSRAMKAEILKLAAAAGVEPLPIEVAARSRSLAAFTLAAPTDDAKRRWSVFIPKFQPTTLNTLFNSHHYEAARFKRNDAALIGHAASEAGVTRAIYRRRVGLIITLGPRQRAADKDAWWKTTLDALVRCGALRDDNPKWVTMTEPEYIRGDERATRITLEDL